MTLADEIKTLDDKIKAHQAHYSLDREAAKIYALSSKELDKYDYLTGEDLPYKLGVIEQAKFEYLLLGNIFNKVLEEGDKKEGLLKRLKNVADKNEAQLKATEYQVEKQLKVIKNQGKNQLYAIIQAKLSNIPYLKSINLYNYVASEEREEVGKRIIDLGKSIDYQHRLYVSGDKVVYNFYAVKSMFESF